MHDNVGAFTNTYTYDDLYHLSSEEGSFSHQYQSDSLHNRLSKDEESYIINSLNQRVDGCRYNANGNLTHYQGREFRYDALDRLIEVSGPDFQVTYTYDAFHRRLSKIINGEETLFLYQEQNEIGAMQHGEIVQLRILGIGLGAEIGAAVALEIDTQVCVPVHDLNGSVINLIDLSGTLIESYRYSAFGEEEI